MKQRLLILFTLALAAMTGCTKDYIVSPDVSSSDNSISFADSSDDWSKSTVFSSSNLAQMEVYAYYTASTPWESVASSDDLSTFMYNQLITKTTSGWTYSPKKYWPADESDMITFYSFAPYGDVSVTTDETTGKPLFSYTLSPYAEYNDDFLVGVNYDQKQADQVIFDLQHALTRVDISARIINADPIDEDDPYNQTLTNGGNEGLNLAPSGEYDVEWTVKDIVFTNVRSKASFTLDLDSSLDDIEINWGEVTDYITLTASEGYTLKAISDSDAVLPYNTTDTKGDYINVCEDDKAIFLVPQTAVEDRSVTVELRLNKRFKYYGPDDDTSVAPTQITDIVYEPDPITLTAWDADECDSGSWLNLIFTYDVDASAVSPLTVTSHVYDYTEINLDITINNNIYIYSDQDEVIEVESSASTADMTFYTNYAYDLTTTVTMTQLDGSELEAHGFIFYFELSSSTSFDVTSYIEPVQTGGSYQISLGDYSFTYSLEKYTRNELGLYVNTTVGEGESSGVNKDSSDSVYKLTIDINDDHLTYFTAEGAASSRYAEDAAYGTFSGTIGVQMLSNAGGMITKLFPITLKKNL